MTDQIETREEAPVPSPRRPKATRERWGRRRVLGVLEAYALLILLIAIAVFFSVWSKTADTFLTTDNFRILVSNQVVPAIVALAALVPLVTMQFDLSVGAISGCVAIFTASMLFGAFAAPVAIALGLLIGAGIGLFTALTVTRAGVSGVIATIAVAALLTGAVQQKTGGVAVSGDLPKLLSDFGNNNILGVPATAWALAVIALAVHFVLAHTPYGRELYAVGSNPIAAKLVGLRIRFLVGSTFVFAGLLAGIAGIIYVTRSGGADPSIGPAFTLTGLAAAFLSAASVKPGKFNVGGTMVAVFFLAVLSNGLNLAGAAVYVTDYVNGGALLIGVALSQLLARRRAAAPMTA